MEERIKEVTSWNEGHNCGLSPASPDVLQIMQENNNHPVIVFRIG